MKKYAFFLFALAASMFTSCQKSGSSPEEGGKETSGLLTDPATGWKRVAVVPFTNSAVGPSPFNGMKGFDLQKTGDQFVVLYTQHKYDPLVFAAADPFYKATVKEGGTATPQQISFGIYAGGGVNTPFTYYAQFLPGSATPVFTGIDYNNNYIDLRDPEGDTYAGAPASNYPLFKYLADGEFIAGSMWVGHESFFWHYKNPPMPRGDFSSSFRPGVIDGNRRLFNIPFKGADGAYYELSLCAKDGRVNYLAVRLREDRTYGSNPPNYEVTDAGNVAGLPQAGFDAGFIELITYDINTANGEITFVFTDYASGAQGSDDRKNIYGYRWKQGSLTRLWQASLSTDTEFRKAIHVFINQNMLHEWRLKTDGTLYVTNSTVNAGSNTSTSAFRLWEVNSSGIKLISSLTPEQTVNKDIAFSTCRFIDGAYYALAYPVRDQLYKVSDPRYHMEIVKLSASR